MVKVIRVNVENLTPQSIDLVPSGPIEIYSLTSTTFNAYVRPDTVIDRDTVVSSSDISIATVQQSYITEGGIKITRVTVNALKSGNVNIRVSSNNYRNIFKMININIIDPDPESITVTPLTINMAQDTSTNFNVNILPENANDRTFNTEIADPTIVSVNGNTITGLKTGTTTVKVSSNKIPSLNKTITVNVSLPNVNKIEITTALVAGTVNTVYEGESYPFLIKLLPEVAADKSFTIKYSANADMSGTADYSFNFGYRNDSLNPSLYISATSSSRYVPPFVRYIQVVSANGITSDIYGLSVVLKPIYKMDSTFTFYNDQ
ncbi:hypothetical protein FPHOBKDP_00111 [Listeria phage LPJP1]|nr:hypothetical protein FPHOBKDP_00111 [Listeria phage LPJP1]